MIDTRASGSRLAANAADSISQAQGPDAMEMGFSMIKARITEASDAADRRGASRLPIDIDARVRPLGEEGSEARILNLSETGFMAETNEAYEVGARVWLMMPGRERANAVVKWVAGDKMGAEFAAPLAIRQAQA